MVTKYQLIILGTKNPLINRIVETFYKRILDLGITPEKVAVIYENDRFEGDNIYKRNAPTYCLYFGNSDGNFQNPDALIKLLADSVLVLPVVADLKKFVASIPQVLRHINGFELSSDVHIEKLVGCILEGLGLLRLSRRLFISYKRDESSTVAIQLFEHLEKAGFDVFLDTHSVRPGEPFQDELWHRLADTDIVVLLSTKSFMKSEWTKQELAKANSMSIGILQVVWPDNSLIAETQLSIPLQLNENDFGNKQFSDAKSYMINETMDNIVNLAESLRARSLASRQDNIIKEFFAAAGKLGISADLQPQKYITMKSPGNKNYVIIPAVGVPQAFTYFQSDNLLTQLKSNNISAAYLLYDHRNIRKNWMEHLSWLDSHLPVKSIKIVEATQWLKSI